MRRICWATEQAYETLLTLKYSEIDVETEQSSGNREELARLHSRTTEHEEGTSTYHESVLPRDMWLIYFFAVLHRNDIMSFVHQSLFQYYYSVRT